MFENNKITKLLGIKYPIIQGGMAGISESSLVSAVSNAGGLGIIGSGIMPVEWLRKEIQKTKELTNNPFAVNLFAGNPNLEGVIRVIIEEQVPIVFTGGGNPLSLFPHFQAAGIKIVTVVPSPRLAKKMEDAGAEAVVVEGLESGGHIGTNTTFCLIPQTKNILERIPLIAAGGIYDEKTALAAFLLGADGIQMGTRFLASTECKINEDYKKKILEASVDEIKVALRFTGHPMRLIKNKLSEEWQKLEEEGAFPEEIRSEKIAGGLASGDVEKALLLAGSCAGSISKIKTCQEIIKEIGNHISNLNNRI